MKFLRLACLVSIAAVGALAACVGDDPANNTPGGGSNDAGGGNGGDGSSTTADGSPAADGSTTTDSGSKDAGPLRFCQTETATVDASDFFCADFDDTNPYEGFVDASAELTDGATIAAINAAAFSQPLGLSTFIPDNPTDDDTGALLGWSHGGAGTISSMTAIAEVSSSTGGGAVTATGDIYLMEVHSGTVTVDLGYTKGGAVNGTDPYSGYLVRVRIATSTSEFALPSIGSGWTKVAITYTYGQPSSTVTVAYDGTQNFTHTFFPGTPNTSVSALVGPQAFGTALGGSWNFDNFEVLTTR